MRVRICLQIQHVESRLKHWLHFEESTWRWTATVEVIIIIGATGVILCVGDLVTGILGCLGPPSPGAWLLYLARQFSP